MQPNIYSYSAADEVGSISLLDARSHFVWSSWSYGLVPHVHTSFLSATVMYSLIVHPKLAFVVDYSCAERGNRQWSFVQVKCEHLRDFTYAESSLSCWYEPSACILCTSHSRERSLLQDSFDSASFWALHVSAAWREWEKARVSMCVCACVCV